MSRGREPRSLAESLRAVTAGFGSRGRAIDLSELWAAAVGPEIAAHAHPERLEESCLVVAVDDPAWATELRYHTAEILAKLNAQRGGSTITEMRLRVQTQTNFG